MPLVNFLKRKNYTHAYFLIKSTKTYSASMGKLKLYNHSTENQVLWVGIWTFRLRILRWISDRQESHRRSWTDLLMK